MAVFCICVVMVVTGHMEPQGTGNVLSSLLYLTEIKVNANLIQHTWPVTAMLDNIYAIT